MKYSISSNLFYDVPGHFLGVRNIRSSRNWVVNFKGCTKNFDAAAYLNVVIGSGYDETYLGLNVFIKK